jgi:hypothetical protein
MYAQWLGTQPEPEAARRRIEASIFFGQRMTTVEEIANMVLVRFNLTLARNADLLVRCWIMDTQFSLIQLPVENHIPNVSAATASTLRPNHDRRGVSATRCYNAP